MNRRLLFCALLLAIAVALNTERVQAWGEITFEFLGINLDYATMSAPSDGDVPTYNSATGKWEAAAGGGGGSTITIKTGGVSQGSADTLDFTNGIKGSSTATAGTFNVSPTFGTSTNTIAQGNDARFNPTPSGGGKIPFDNGVGGYTVMLAGTADQLLMGGSSPSFTTVAGDLSNSAGTFTIANNAVTDAKFRQGVAKSLVGVTGSVTANVADITGTANQIPIINSTGTGLSFVTLSGDVTNTNGVVSIATGAVTSAKIGTGEVQTTNLGTNVVTDAKFRQGVARSLVGVAGNATANVADIQGTANQIPIVNSGGTALAFTTLSGDVTNSSGAVTIANSAVTLAKMANVATDTVLGRETAATGVVEALTLGGASQDLGTAASNGAADSTVARAGHVHKGVVWQEEGVNLDTGNGNKTVNVVGDGSTASATGGTATLTILASPADGHYRNLVIRRTSVTALTVTADTVVLRNTTSNKVRTFRSVSETITITTAGASGLEASDSEAANTWYEIRLIAKDSDGTIDGILNAAGGSITTMPTNYGLQTPILGYIRNDGSSNLKFIHQFNDEVMVERGANILGTSLSATSNTDVDASAACPPGARLALLEVGVRAASSDNDASATLVDKDAGVDIYSPYIRDNAAASTSLYSTSIGRITLNASQVFQYRVQTNSAVDLIVIGWSF